MAATMRVAEQPLLRRLPLRELAEQLGVVAEREVDRLRAASSTSRHDRTEVAARRRSPPTSIGARRPRAGWRSGSAATVDARDVAQRHASAGRRVDGRLRMSSRLSRACGRAPDLHVVGLAVAEDVADLLAGDHGRRGPARRRPA